MLTHCTGYCVKGINSDSWKNIEDICIENGIIFNSHFERSRKPIDIFNYNEIMEMKSTKVEGMHQNYAVAKYLALKKHPENETLMYLREEGF